MAPDVAELTNIALFAGLSPATLEALCAGLEVVELPAGARLCDEGAPGRELWVVLGGELEARRGAGSDGKRAVFGPGEWLGDMALLDLQGQPWTVDTAVPSRLVRIPAGTLDAFYRRDLKSYALLWMNAARELSRRLRTALGATSAGALERRAS